MGRENGAHVDERLGRLIEDDIELRPLMTRGDTVLRSFLLLYGRFVGYYDPPTGTVHYLEDVAESDQLRVHRLLRKYDNRKSRKVARPPPLLADEAGDDERKATTTAIWLPEGCK